MRVGHVTRVIVMTFLLDEETGDDEDVFMDWNLEENKKQRMNYILTWKKEDRKNREEKTRGEQKSWKEREQERNEDSKLRKRWMDYL